jgi:hypothetical protein
MTDFPRKRPNDSAAYEYTPMKEVLKAKWAVWLVDGLDDDFDRLSDSDDSGASDQEGEEECEYIC